MFSYFYPQDNFLPASQRFDSTVTDSQVADDLRGQIPIGYYGGYVIAIYVAFESYEHSRLAERCDFQTEMFC